MVNAPVLVQILQLAPYAVGTGIIFLIGAAIWSRIPAFMAQWLEFKKARAAEKAADWTRLRDEIRFLGAALQSEREERRIERIEQQAENERCRSELAAAVRRIAELEGFMMGQGHARAEAQTIVSIERLTDAADKAKGEGK